MLTLPTESVVAKADGSIKYLKENMTMKRRVLDGIKGNQIELLEVKNNKFGMKNLLFWHNRKLDTAEKI